MTKTLDTVRVPAPLMVTGRQHYVMLNLVRHPEPVLFMASTHWHWLQDGSGAPPPWMDTWVDGEA